MDSVILKDGTAIDLRKAQVSDAAEIVKFYNFIGGETQFLSFGENEFPNDVAAQEKSTASTLKEENSIMLLALCKDEIAGIITLNSTQKQKGRHMGCMGIGIKQAYCKKGLGRLMLESVIDFAKQNGITKKITLITREDNESAIALYHNLGFADEGVLKSEGFENGRYYDEIYMGLFV